MSERFFEMFWQKLFEPVMAIADGRVVFDFFKKLLANAERMNNAIKGLLTDKKIFISDILIQNLLFIKSARTT